MSAPQQRDLECLRIADAMWWVVIEVVDTCRERDTKGTFCVVRTLASSDNFRFDSATERSCCNGRSCDMRRHAQRCTGVRKAVATRLKVVHAAR